MELLSDEEQVWAKDVLSGMGYEVEAELLSQFSQRGEAALSDSSSEPLLAVQRDLKELGVKDFMKGIPKGTPIRHRASFKRFIKALNGLDREGDSEDEGEKPKLSVDPHVVDVPDLSQEARFNLTLHNISSSFDSHTLKVRVIHNCRFVEYTLIASKHAKLYLEEGSYLSIVSQHDAGGPQLHRGMSTKGIKKGGLVYASMRAQRHFSLGHGDPLPALMQGASVYHLGFFDPDDVRIYHTQPGEDKNASNLTELSVNRSCVVVPREKSTLHLDSWKTQKTQGTQRAHKEMPREPISIDLAAANFCNRHVYLQKMNHFDHWTGSQLNDHDDWDAEADLKKVVPQDFVISHERFHIILHNTSPEKAKFQLNVKVKSEQGEAAYKLDSHSCATLYLPQDSLLEVESESLEEWQAKGSMNVELQSLKAGANVYVLSEPDHKTNTPGEQKMICFFILLMATGVGLPLGIILACICSKKFKERQEKFPLLNLSHQSGPPSKGRTSASSTLWHFLGRGLETMFARCIPGDANGIALAPGESCALDAGAGAAFQIAIREQLPDEPAIREWYVGDRGSELIEMRRECDSNFSKRHIYVWKTEVTTEGRSKVEMEIRPGSLVKGTHPCWDAFKDFGSDARVDVEDNTPSNMPSNMPSNTPSNRPDPGSRPDPDNRPDPPGVVAEEP